MAEKSRLKVAILNRYFPPNRSVTGNSAYELQKHLRNNKSLQVSSISISANYKGAKNDYENEGDNHYLPALYQGNNKGLRFIFNLIEGYKLVKKSLAIESDVVITLTDPPLLNFWGARLLKKNKGVKWVNWTMDLYPDAFDSAGLVSSKNVVYQYFYHTIRNNKPDLVVALGNSQKQYLIDKYYGNNTKFLILPCGIHEDTSSKEKPAWAKKDKIIFCYAGNLGEAHSDSFLVNFLKLMDPARHHLILSLYGGKSERVLALVKDGKLPVTLLNSVSKEDFGYIDIHLVSLLPEWTNICVPSKAVSAICAGSSVLFYGNRKSDTSRMLDSASFFIAYSDQEEKEMKSINDFLKDLTPSLIAEKKINSRSRAESLVQQKIETFNSIESWLVER